MCRFFKAGDLLRIGEVALGFGVIADMLACQSSGTG